MASLKEIDHKYMKAVGQRKDKKETDVEYLLKSIPQLDKICNVKKKIGQGTFSKVYYGEAKHQCKKFNPLWAIKHIVPTTHPSKVLDEIACLKSLGGCDNVIPAVHCLRNENHIALIMPFVRSDNFRNYVGKLKPQELCSYMQQLLTALRKVHSCDYIHRDVKPSNFLYSRSHDSCALIDFGLVQKTNRKTIKNTDVLNSTSTPITPISGKRIRDCNDNDEDHPAKRILTDLNQSSQLMSKSPKKLPLESPPRETMSKKATNGWVNGPVLDSPSKHTRAAECTRIANGYSQKHITNDVNSPHMPSNLGKTQQQKANCSISSKLYDKASCSTPRFSLQQVRTRSGRSELRMLKNTCNCFGSPRVCKFCLEKSTQCAQRSGTPGFRPPEVLLKHPNQTAAVDVWSAGVILLCLLSGRYPFFQAVDDCTALAEITCLLGTQVIRRTAEKLQKKFITSEDKPALSLFIVCESLRKNISECQTCRKKNNCLCKQKSQSGAESPTDATDGLWDIAYPREFYDLLASLLDPNPFSRISAKDALNHRVFSLYAK